MATKIFEIQKNLWNITPIIDTMINENLNTIPLLMDLITRPINQKSIDIQREFMKRHLDGYGLCLDLGVGFGASGAEFAKSGYVVHGMDIDPFALISSTCYISYLLKKPYLTLLGDINIAELPKTFYDVFSCTQTLEHILEDQNALNKLYACLRKGGYGFITIPIDNVKDKGKPREVEALDMKFYSYGDVNEYTDEKFSRMLHKAGFQIYEKEQYEGAGGGEDKRYYYCMAYLVRKE